MLHVDDSSRKYRKCSRRERKCYTFPALTRLPFRLARSLIKDMEPYLTPGERSALERAARTSSYEVWDNVVSEFSLSEIAKLSPFSDRETIAAKRLIGSILQKTRLVGDAEARLTAAVNTVVEGDKTCSNYNRKDYKKIHGTHYLRSMQKFCSIVLGHSLPDFVRLVDGARHGPGAVAYQKLPYGLSDYQKYSQWPYTVTSGARQYAIDLISQDELWLGALQASYRSTGGVPPDLAKVEGTLFGRRYTFASEQSIAPWTILNSDTFWNTVLEVVPGNKITSVPKSRLKDRPIAVEPTMNVMLQLGVDSFVRKRLKRKFGVDLNSQVPNQQLARVGSIDPTLHSPATIDLSSASDSISLRIAKLVLPSEWYNYLTAIRSPKGHCPDGRVLRYSKLSSMGNGSTFAIESLIFAAAIFAVVEAQGLKWRDLPIAVFGDDLIVPEFLVWDLIHVLELSGFSVNSDKSFVTGHVKESCGTDWFRAYPVRPIYLKEIPSSLPELFHIHNSLWMWSRYHAIPLPSTLAYLVKVINHSGGRPYKGPPTECTNEYVFDDHRTSIRGLARIISERRPKDFLFGKLIGIPRRTSVPTLWRPLHEARFKSMSDGSTVFTDAHPQRWHWEAYTGSVYTETQEIATDSRTNTYWYLNG